MIVQALWAALTISALWASVRGVNRALAYRDSIRSRGLNGDLEVQAAFSLTFWRSCLAACGACVSALVFSTLRNLPDHPALPPSDSLDRFFGFMVLLSLFGFLAWFNVLVWKAWRAEQ